MLTCMKKCYLGTPAYFDEVEKNDGSSVAGQAPVEVQPGSVEVGVTLVNWNSRNDHCL